MSDTFLKSLVRSMVGGIAVAITPWGFQVSSPNAGIGYAPGAGGVVVQLTSKITGFTLNTMSGQITFNNSALAGFCVTSSATWTCSGMGSNDVVVFSQTGGSLGAYEIGCVCSNGQGQIYITNNSSTSLSEAVVVSFAIIEGAAS
jgi:hypothetical protein